MYEEPKMEKLTINLPPIEIARIDILIEAGYYPSRAEFIRAAIRRTLDDHKSFIAKMMGQLTSNPELNSEESYSTVSGVGVLTLDKNLFEKSLAQRKRIRIRAVGMLIVKKDVTPKHIEEAVDDVRVYGVLRASAEVKEALRKKQRTGD